MKYESIACGPKPIFDIWQVMELRDKTKVGDKVYAEVLCTVEGTASAAVFEERTVKVTILEKYPHIARTDRGTVSWVNILLHNTSKLREDKQ